MTKRITGKPARQTTFGALVDKVDGPERSKPDDVYEFNNGKRVFKDPGKYGGPYKQS